MPTFTSFTETGGDHKANEDVFAVVAHPLDPDIVICVMADGLGGQPGGGRAAEVACRTVVDAAKETPPYRLEWPATWPKLLRAADEAVRADAAAGLTTVVALSVGVNGLYGASCGDSAALIVTADDQEELTRGQWKNPPVGSGEAEPVGFVDLPAEPWKLLVMTDGVWKYAGWRKLIDAARHLAGAELVAECQRAARLPGSGRFQDDFTLVVIEPDAGKCWRIAD